ncbi:MAG TPA: hypothetical protein VML55_18740 [Planctomycetaceae bacterium]|nr:hypothetical protein [Planctomycetaceae bacterium]
MTGLITTAGIVAFVASLAVSAPCGGDTQRPEPAEVEAPAVADSPAGHTWTKSLKDRAGRGTLEGVRQSIRGDTGKWSDEPRVQHAPPVEEKPARMPLDEWADELVEKEFELTSNDDAWLLFRSRQLDDNDRIWVERIMRRGNRLTVVAHQAVWQGRYQKNFTHHVVVGVNLGRLEAGAYEARWIIKPLVFNKFDEPRRADNWPVDERSGDGKPTELPLAFTVVPSAPSRP